MKMQEEQRRIRIVELDQEIQESTLWNFLNTKGVLSES